MSFMKVEHWREKKKDGTCVQIGLGQSSSLERTNQTLLIHEKRQYQLRGHGRLIIAKRDTQKSHLSTKIKEAIRFTHYRELGGSGYVDAHHPIDQDYYILHPLSFYNHLHYPSVDCCPLVLEFYDDRKKGGSYEN